MQISTLLSLSFLLLSWVSLKPQGFGPVPAPDSDNAGSESVDFSPSSPKSTDPPALPPVAGSDSVAYAPAPDSEDVDDGLQDNEEMPGESSTTPSSQEVVDPSTVKWCAVRDEFEDCKYYLSLLRQSDGYAWKCVKRNSTQACLESIKKGEADLITLEPGMAYIAFVNYSMKAIANEVYCRHAENYNAVAVVNRKTCNKNGDISLIDFKGQRSCHGGRSTAVGWNYLVKHLNELVVSKKLSDKEIVTGFFSEVCAPSEFEGMGVCSGCESDTGSCHSDSSYSGDLGAFRCLVEELGDIAFVKEDTALLFSMEGPNNQTWSTKSVSDFMYLCPQGGCREINGYPGACSLGTVPANVIMASNSISSNKRSAVLQTLLNATWVDALYTGKNGAGHLLSSSAQGIATINKLTRSYLGESASISQHILELNTKQTSSSENSVPEASSSPSPSAQAPWTILAFVGLLISMISVFSPQ